MFPQKLRCAESNSEIKPKRIAAPCFAMIDKNMQKWTKNNRETPLTISVLLFPDFSNHCLANAIEPFRAANDVAHQALCNWRYLSLEGGLVRSSSGLEIKTAALTPDDCAVDYLMVISSYGYRDLVSVKLNAHLRMMKARAKTVIGLDTGAWLLAEAGLLNGRKATIHRVVLNEFSERFLDVEVCDARYIKDQNIISCGGAMAAFDLGLDLIGRAFGEALRLDVATLLLFMTPQPTAEGDYSAPQGGDLVQCAIDLMDKHREDPLTISQLAERLNCDEKYLQRRSMARLGAPIGRLYRQRRLRFIRHLIENTDLAIAEIALRGGFISASAMTRAFKKTYGMTPLALRQGI